MGTLVSSTSEKTEVKNEWDKPLFNRYDPYVIKAKLDEFIVHELNTSYKYKETHRYSNIKLLIGFIAILFTAVCHVYEYIFNAHFPKDYNITVVCVVGYFFFNLLYQWFEYYYEKETFYQGDPGIKGIASIDISSTIKKFDKHYQVSLFIYRDSSPPLIKTFIKSVEFFFNEDGYMVKPAVSLFLKDVTQSLTSKLN